MLNVPGYPQVWITGGSAGRRFMQVRDLWNDVVERLQTSIEASELACWVGAVQPCALEGDVLVLEVPARVHLERLETRYRVSIEAAASDARGRRTSVSLALGGACAKPSRAASPLPFPSRYTFERFVAGESNRLAFQSSRCVAERPGERFNPLFLWGGVGLGKTHLVTAIANAIAGRMPGKRIALVSAEVFTNELIRAIRSERTEGFRSHFRRVEVLIVDDIQFLAGKERTQEEFFHTFDSLHGNGKQLVLASDRPPSEIVNLEQRLRDRFECGLITEIGFPEYTLRKAIVARKAELLGLRLEDDVVEWIAERIVSSVRELEGALARLAIGHELRGGEIDRAFAASILEPILRAPEAPTVPRVQRLVADRFRVTLEELTGRRRSVALVPRQVAMYLSRKRTAATFSEIASGFGSRNHSTVMHAVKVVEERRALEPGFAAILESLEAKLARV